MKTFVSSLLSLGILAVSSAWLVRAADPPLSLSKGKVLILKNEYTVEGDIERVGDRYCVRRKLGETWVPAERVQALLASLPDAYVYLRERINIDDPDERLRLARWCRNNGLQKQALVELQAAAELRPSHAETKRLLHYWQQVAATAANRTPMQNPVSKNPTGAPSASVEPSPIEVTTETLGQFATRVQPILMNTCARCHATGRGGKFNLTQVFEDGFSNRRTLERNLASVLAEVNVNQPETSLLLIKAVSDHAHTGQAPLRDRQAVPYRSLENWVKLVVADNPHLREKAEARVPKVDMPTFPPEETHVKAGSESQWGAEARPKSTGTPSPVARGDKEKAATPAPATTTDPYDPEPFNRKVRPEANK